jgi:hypothetical protein
VIEIVGLKDDRDGQIQVSGLDGQMSGIVRLLGSGPEGSSGGNGLPLAVKTDYQILWRDGSQDSFLTLEVRPISPSSTYYSLTQATYEIQPKVGPLISDAKNDVLQSWK